MKLRDALEGCETIGAVPDVEITGLDYDSRRVEPGFAFFAFPGENVDGHRFIPAAREAGASAIVSERPRPEQDGADWVQVRHGRQALALASLAFYDHPDRRIKIVAVTGTNGKTTTVYLIDSVLRAAGYLTARLGTIEHRIGDKAIPAINTTPESLDLVRFLAQLEGDHGSFACVESSSHALELGRFFGFHVHAAVFTNLSQDHLDFHGDMESYARSKRRLFEGNGAPPPKFGVINADDPVGRQFLALDGFRPLSYALDRDADVTAANVRTGFEGLQFELRTPQGSIELHSPLLGLFNVRNLLAAAAASLACEVDLETIRQGLESSHGAPGRFETVREGQDFLVAVDYAHTHDALENLIQSARQFLPKGGRILTMFGCGGDRDRAKRALMGEVAGRLSDRVILTSDNPRSEDPLRIMADAMVGLQRVDADCVREPDRAKAIRLAIQEARPGDIVLLAGKGHETVQKVAGRALPFDDREVAREVLRELRNGRRAG
ncbi:MAG: UDP-N-acetylmuramoyl-L-alanyl-D-glutamate--2,6-diaminopimelate ligase [Bryobacterales bacterium]